MRSVQPRFYAISHTIETRGNACCSPNLLCVERMRRRNALRVIAISPSTFPPGVGSVLPHGDAGPFPVSVTGSAEGPARGSVVPGGGSCAGPGALRQCPLAELRPGPPGGAGGSLPLLERCSSGRQTGGSSPRKYAVWLLNVQNHSYSTLLINSRSRFSFFWLAVYFNRPHCCLELY